MKNLYTFLRLHSQSVSDTENDDQYWIQVVSYMLRWAFRNKQFPWQIFFETFSNFHRLSQNNMYKQNAREHAILRFTVWVEIFHLYLLTVANGLLSGDPLLCGHPDAMTVRSLCVSLTSVPWETAAFLSLYACNLQWHSTHPTAVVSRSRGDDGPLAGICLCDTGDTIGWVIFGMCLAFSATLAAWL